jgi:acyl-CoA synthetase (AMP-forming)/AMP-acid ligase II
MIDNPTHPAGNQHRKQRTGKYDESRGASTEFESMDQDLWHQEQRREAAQICGYPDRAKCQIRTDKELNQLASFKVPTRLEIMDSLPRTTVGKLNKTKIRELGVNIGLIEKLFI